MPEETQDQELDVELLDGDPSIAGDISDENEEVIDEETNEETTDEENNEEETDEEKEIKAKDAKFQSITEVNKKYPKFFKDFPNLRHAFFHEREYRKVFPSVDEAREAATASEELSNFRSSIVSGEVKDLSGTIKSFKDLGDDVVPNLAVNFLPALKASSPDDYYAAITPELVSFIRALYDNGERNGNDNLKNAGLLAAIHFFNDQKVATGERKIESTVAKTKDSSVENERKQFRQERYTIFYNDVVQDCEGQLLSLVKNNLDPQKRMSEAMQDMVAERIIKEIGRVLSSDKSHTSQMSARWREADKNSFSSAYKTKIINTYLGRAKEILPTVRAKIRSAALGTKQRSSSSNSNSNENGRNVEDRREPKNNAGGNGNGGRSSNSNRDSGKEIDWSKTTDANYLAGKITYKK